MHFRKMRLRQPQRTILVLDKPCLNTMPQVHRYLHMERFLRAQRRMRNHNTQ